MNIKSFFGFVWQKHAFNEFTVEIQQFDPIVHIIKLQGLTMASSAHKTIANRANASQSTGPKSRPGKAKVSTNAIRHGAKAKNFINPEEEKTYQTFLKGLKGQYNSQNPIVSAQLERIAKIKIQLDRVQKIIDASFIASQDPEQIDSSLMDLLQMDYKEKRMAEKIASGKLTLPKTIRHNELRVAAELVHLDTSNFETTEDFLHYTPLMCKYLYKKACKHEIDVDTYITQYASHYVNAETIQELLVDILYIDKNKKAEEEDIDIFSDNLETNTIEGKIKNTKLINLKKAAEILKGEINKLADVQHKVIAFNQLRQAEISPLTINYDNLDKLYRYQTTLQRQYSTVLGELLVLTKNGL